VEGGRAEGGQATATETLTAVARARRFRVLVAIDGSPAARAALAVAVAFPWPPEADARAVIARRAFSGAQVAADWPVAAWAALDAGLSRIRAGARRVLRRRWPEAEAVVVDQPAVTAILAEADRIRASVIVVGSRGYTALGRLLLGSVSRGIVRQARVPVLVAKGRPRPVRRLVIGLEGSPNARRALGFLAGLPAPVGGRVTLARVVEPIRVPSMGLAPASVRGAVRAQADELNARSARRARRETEAAAALLTRAGWRARPVVRFGVPLPELLGTVTADRADLLVLGARGVGGVARLLLGSVAEGALTRSRVPVLIVR
jgi:nucleotide-binding universal stress UspA family protein